MRRLFVATIIALSVVSCATNFEHRRVTLGDVDTELGRRFQSEDDLNGLHPSHIGTERGERIVWIDFCEKKECRGAELTYTRLSRQVAVTTATVVQLAFVVEQVEDGAVSAEAAEPFLEFGWTALPAIEERLDRQQAQLEALEPDNDFRRESTRQKGWDVVAVSAGQLEVARTRLQGLDERLAGLYRTLEPAFACEEPEPVRGVVLEESDELDARLRQATEVLQNIPRYRRTALTDENVVRILLELGMQRVERMAVAPKTNPSVFLTRLRVEGPLEVEAVRTWFAVQIDQLEVCLPQRRTEPLDLEVLADYSSEAVVSDVRIAHVGLEIAHVRCLRRALGGTAIPGDIPGARGSLSLGVAVAATHDVTDSDSRRKPGATPETVDLD